MHRDAWVEGFDLLQVFFWGSMKDCGSCGVPKGDYLHCVLKFGDKRLNFSVLLRPETLKS